MRIKISLCLIIFLFLLFLAVASPFIESKETSGEKIFKIVVNRKNTMAQVSQEDLARIYLGKKVLWDDDTRIIPVMLHERNPAMQVFIKNILHKSVGQYHAYWKSRLFSGGGTVPKTFRTSVEVLDFIAKNPVSIGVVEASAIEEIKEEDRVKVIVVGIKE